mmetsp:Transcript_37827/g.121672  ORF Transcript_37827/g.121672 Transcript_37827/m.121672 type:complete len:250 (-) Transcript_37827:1493-2242(-)
MPRSCGCLALDAGPAMQHARGMLVGGLRHARASDAHRAEHRMELLAGAERQPALATAVVRACRVAIRTGFAEDEPGLHLQVERVVQDLEAHSVQVPVALGVDQARSMPPRALLAADLEVGHHARVLVVQQVAVEDLRTDEGVGLRLDHGLARAVHQGVGPIAHLVKVRIAAQILEGHDLEVVDVHVEGMDGDTIAIILGALRPAQVPLVNFTDVKPGQRSLVHAFHLPALRLPSGKLMCILKPEVDRVH